MSLYQQILGASEQRTTKQDFISYYQSRYGAGWKRAAAIKISGTNDAKARSYQSVMRNFQGKRLHQEGDTIKWHELTKDLPPMPPEDGYHIHGKIWLKYSEECEEREVDVVISGDEAQRLLSTSVEYSLINAYNEQGIDDEPPASPCNEEGWSLSVN